MCYLLAQICMKSMLFLLFTVPICGQEEFELPVVQTRNGRIRGFRIQLEPPSTLEAAVIYRQADIFLGIPFAQAPVGPLRLERPLPAANWTVTLDASSIPPACVPVHVLAAPDFSEDCLYLNVFRPFSPVADKSFPQQRRQQQFPVLVFIHGGGFCVGGSFVEGYNNISNNFVSQGILVVSIQYRLNFLGFFSDGSAQNPGNLGLWDQRQALLWIRENIALFGGDPGRVTVWGQSAGAASVSFLSISPHSRDLFHQAIQQSGSFLSPWAMNDRVVEVCQKTASTLGCAIGRAKNKDQRQCLEEVQIDDLMDAIQQLEMVRSDFAMVVYNPRADDDFVPKNIGRALTTAPKKPTLMGFNRHESMFLTIHYPVSVFAFDSPLTVADVHSYNRSQLVNFIRSCVKLEQQNGTGSEEWSEQIARRLEAFYADGEVKGSTATWRHFLEQYTLLLTDVQFLVPILAEARLKAAQGWPLFLYQFDHINREHAKKLPFRGIVHAAEYPYTLGAELFGNYQLDDDDRLVQASLLRAYGTFVKTGIPQPSLPNSTDWRPTIGLGPDSPLHILRFGQDTKPQLETDPAELIEKIRFWRSLSREKGFSRVNGFPKIIP